MIRAATFVIMFVFWMFLSGMFDVFHLFLGVLCSALVAWLSADLLFAAGRSAKGHRVIGMLGYLPWLFWQILVANLQLTAILLHPRMMERINPQILRFHTRLRTPFARVTFGQSITLTPGTVTVNIDDDEFTVYALTDASAASLPGEMERRIAAALEGEKS